MRLGCICLNSRVKGAGDMTLVLYEECIFLHIANMALLCQTVVDKFP